METTFNQLMENLKLAANKNCNPLEGSFELTSRCNLKCKMCYLRKSVDDKSVINKELTAEQWINIAKQARDEGLLFLTLTGGEILLRPDFREIYEGISQLGLIITLFTNGTLITEEIVDWLSKLPPRKVTITLYGASEETYKNVTGHSEAYDSTIKAIDLLMSRNIKVELKTTLIEGNKQDVLKLYDYAYKRSIPFGFVKYVFPCRENINANPLGNRLPPKELVALEKHISKYVVNNEGINLESAKSSLKNENKNLFNELGDANNTFKCDVGKSMFWIKWDGTMLPCSIMETPSISILNIGFQRAWRELISILGQVESCLNCKTCDLVDYCLSCPGRLYIENGRFDKPATYLCEYANELKNNYI